METNNNGIPNEDDLDATLQSQELQNDDSPTQIVDDQDENGKHRHHSKHGHTRYKMFSNHSSWNDSPHTNTSF